MDTLAPDTSPGAIGARQTTARGFERAAEILLANEWTTAALIFACTRLVALAGAYVGVERITRAEPARDKGWLAELALMWDATWYVGIVQHGYQYHPSAEGGTNIAFPPLYPFLIQALSTGLGWLSFGWDWGNATFGRLIASGLVISNVSFYLALVLLIRLLAPRLGRPRASTVALAMAALPLSFFFSAIYTEGLFLLLAIGVLAVARTNWRQKWLAASAVGALAALLKFAGILLFAVLLVEYLAQREWNVKRIRADIMWLAWIPAALCLFPVYLWWRFGSPLSFLDSEYKGWAHQASFFAGTYWDAAAALWQSFAGDNNPATQWIMRHGDGNRLYAVLDVVSPVLLLAGAFVARSKLMASEWAWLAVGILYPLSSGTTNSLARYMLPLWPGLVWIGMLRGKWKWLGAAWIAVSLVLLAWCAGIYGNAKWIG